MLFRSKIVQEAIIKIESFYILGLSSARLKSMRAQGVQGLRIILLSTLFTWGSWGGKALYNDNKTKTETINTKGPIKLQVTTIYILTFTYIQSVLGVQWDRKYSKDEL